MSFSAFLSMGMWMLILQQDVLYLRVWNGVDQWFCLPPHVVVDASVSWAVLRMM